MSFGDQHSYDEVPHRRLTAREHAEYYAEAARQALNPVADIAQVYAILALVDKLDEISDLLSPSVELAVEPGPGSTHLPPKDERPHSRACGIRSHPHGYRCHMTCPTCGGKP